MYLFHSVSSEPQEQGSAHVVSMLQEILNLLNVSSPSDNMLQKIMDLIFVILEQMPNAHLLTLPTITAGESDSSHTVYGQSPGAHSQKKCPIVRTACLNLHFNLDHDTIVVT